MHFWLRAKTLTQRLRKMGRIFQASSATFLVKSPSGLQPAARETATRLGVALAGSFAFALLLVDFSPSFPQGLSLRSGETAEVDILSPLSVDIRPKTFFRNDPSHTAKKVAPVYDFDDNLLSEWTKRWSHAFEKLRGRFYTAPESRRGLKLDEVSAAVVELTGQKIRYKDLLYLHQNGFNIHLQEQFIALAEQLAGRMISANDLFPLYYGTGLLLRTLDGETNEAFLRDVSRIWSLHQTREYIAAYVKTNPSLTPTLVEAFCNLIPPNVTFNEKATQKRISSVVSRNLGEVISIRKGQTLVRKGERISDFQEDMLRKMAELVGPWAVLKRFLAAWATLLILLSLALRMNLTGRGLWKLSYKDIVIFLGLLLATTLGVKLGIPIGKAFVRPLGFGDGVPFAMPVAAGSVIAQLLLGNEVGLVFAILQSLLLGYLLDQSYFYGVWGFAVMMIANLTIRSCRQRTDLYRTGIWSGLMGALLSAVWAILQTQGMGRMDWVQLGACTSASLLSGLFTSTITGSMIPFFESFFGYTTSLKLLELSNFNHYLLHSLMMKAPGTYHHSIIVGSLAEIAADKIKANSLLARVSAYYHDIGKMNKPLYFIENQSGQENPHDLLQPSMSAKVLFSHVKDGVRLGRLHKLGKKITDIIEQHHGTTLANYFFSKAKKLEKPELDPVNESDFRYPGPKPQTREAAIVMLADACEAATRSIQAPTVAKIQNMVHTILQRRLNEAQFHECDLTLKDLQTIEEAFARTLVSIYHNRIEYPQHHPPEAKSTVIPLINRNLSGTSH